MVRCTHPTAPRGFTLVELLVVIAIIGILVGLTIPAVQVVRRHAKNFAISSDLKQFEMACQEYKNKFGEYPPDFSEINTVPGQSVVLRHLARAFPRYQPGPPGGWNGFVADVQTRWTVNLAAFTPREALVFWLGGQPIVSGTGAVTGFAGFSANPQNPFESIATSPSRIGPFFEFDPSRVGYIAATRACHYWPQGINVDQTLASLDTMSGAIVYFRAENGLYMAAAGPKTTKDIGDTATTPDVYAAGDTRLGFPATATAWINPKSFQIFSSGQDVRYSTPIPPGGLQFPTGGNYDPDGRTYDDITNFSNGTLESNMP